MEDSTNSTQRPRRDAFHSVAFERDGMSPLPVSTPSAARGQSARGLGHHAKWIVINLAWIVIMAWLFAHVAIPRLMAYLAGGETHTEKVRPLGSNPNGAPSREKPAASRQSAPTLAPDIKRGSDRASAAAKSGEMRCINGQTFIVHRDGDRSRIEAVGTRCDTSHNQ